MVKINTKQSGAVIIVGLIFIVVLTMIGISALNATSLADKMTHNMRDKNIAFQASESALHDGENWLLAQTNIPEAVTSCQSAPCNVWDTSNFNSVWLMPDSFWTTQARPFTGTIHESAAQPSYLVEQENFVPYELSPDARSKGQGYYFYRVTARGIGATTNTQTIVESIYVTKYN